MNSHHSALHRQDPNEGYGSLDSFESNFENQQYQQNFNHLSFPYKLYHLLQNETNDSIQWYTNGLGFHVSNSNKFTNELVNKYFKRKCFIHLILTDVLT